MASNSRFGQIMEEGDSPGFFKILRKNDLSSSTMRGIPNSFIRSISDKDLVSNMVLKLPWGSSWPIKVSKNPRFYYMEQRGWDQFLSDNSLGANEFVTFTHIAKMCFNVNIYQMDCKEMLIPRNSKTISSSSSSSDQNKREQEKSIYQNVMKEEVESFSEPNCLVPKPAESTGRRLRQKREINLGKKKVEEGKTSKKKMKVGTNCKDSEAETSSLVPPEFTLTIRKSYLWFLGIPKGFVDKHLPKETTMFKIHHWKGNKSWKVKYVVTDVQSRISAGWIRLVKDLALEVGDVCNFRLINPTQMILKVTKN